MYAVIQTGGKQYRVEPSALVRVEKLEAEVGTRIEFDQVLLLADGENVRVGTPFVPGAAVAAEIVEHFRDRKIVIFKYRRRKNYRRKAGHRQPYTALRVTEIRA
jgi:large subunit ribosomal protein L21